MGSINNYEVYNERMAKTIDDKLFWLEQLADEVGVIVDYGCGNGTMLNKIEELYPYRFILIGYDNNPEMIRQARAKVINNKNIVFVDNMNSLIEVLNAVRKPTVINFSSVLHEVYTYSNFDELAPLFNAMRMYFLPVYITVRDMHFDGCNVVDSEKLLKAVRGSEMYADYKKCRMQNDKNLVEFFLKYDYIENWDREKKEIYFFPYLQFEALLKRYYECIYKEKFSIPYIKGKIKADFGIDFGYNTHIKAIYKIKY